MDFLDDPFEMSVRSLGFGVQSVLCPVKIICRCFAKRLSCQEVILFALGSLRSGRMGIGSIVRQC